LTLEEIDTIFEIKYEGGPQMTYKEATRLSHIQAKARRQSIEKDKSNFAEEVEVISEKP